MVRVLVHRQSGLASRHEPEQEVQMLKKSVFSSVTVASLGHQFPQTQHCWVLYKLLTFFFCWYISHSVDQSSEYLNRRWPDFFFIIDSNFKVPSENDNREQNTSRSLPDSTFSIMKNEFLLAICRTGYYSTNYGVEPCEKCPKGTYQEMEQQTQCHSCPSGTHTEGTGSTSLHDCICKFACKPLNITSRKAREAVFNAHKRNTELVAAIRNSL